MSQNITVILTPAQLIALNQATAGSNRAAFIREVLAEKVAQMGIIWPDDMKAVGRQKKSITGESQS